MDARRADFGGSRAYVSLAGAGRRYGTSTNQWNCLLQSPHLDAAIQRLSDSPTWPPPKQKPRENFRSAGFLNLAERVRFELTVPLKVHWISSPAHSTTLPPFRVFQLTGNEANSSDPSGSLLGRERL